VITTSHCTESRRAVLKSLAVAGGAAVLAPVFQPFAALAQDAADPRVTQILAGTMSVDLHSHLQIAYARATPLPPSETPPAGRAGGRGGGRGPAGPPPTAAEFAQALKLSGFTTVCETFVPVDGSSPMTADDYYAYHRQMMDYADRLVAGGIRRALTMKDVETAKAGSAAIFIHDSEGAQWIAGHLERIEEAYRRGLRKIQLVHSRNDVVKPLADLQNPPSTAFNGLTPFGADVIRESERLGIVIDLAHAAQGAVEGALKVANKPLLVSHTALNTPTGRGNNPGMLPRLLTREHAKAVADANGVVGVWHLFATLKEYVAEVREMVDVIGVDHVAIGTDTSVVGNETTWPEQKGGVLYAIVAEMLAQGFTPDQISKVAGGNFFRVFAASTGKATV
jgi:membrane dipeptidase